MARPRELPHPPRVAPPDLPPLTEVAHGLQSNDEYFQVRVEDLPDETDAAHVVLTECTVAAASVSRLDIAGATLVDVAVDDLRAAVVSGRHARLRRVRFTGGRIGTLDLSAAALDEVELRGVRVDYLSLAGAKIEDLLVSDCTITTLDLPQATVSRVRFVNSRAQEVDTRGMRAENVDLRGLDATSYLDVASLRGATLTPWQVEQLAAAFALAHGVDVRD
jgi:uncharacterized protein YjbI with pentapeptide repeats